MYVSEVAEKAMNPNFRNIHFDSNHPQLLRLDELTLKFWAKSEAMSQYSLLIDMTLSMRSLQFIGKSVSFLTLVSYVQCLSCATSYRASTTLFHRTVLSFI